MDLNKLYQHFLASKGVCTDTRQDTEDKLFFALRGEHFNGNKFAAEALAKGATVAIVDDSDLPEDPRFIKVENVLRTLQRLATYHRDHLNVTIIAITGSNGKTTTKELAAHVLSRKFNLHYTQGNLNNHIGVPLTLLAMSESTELGIVEMGANHRKEIADLCEMAQPDYGYITNFGKAHLEGFGGIEGVIEGKSELYEFLREHNKKIIVNADDQVQMEQTHNSTRISFSRTADADYQIEFLGAEPHVTMKYAGQTIKSQLLGDYNAENIAAAICMGAYFSVPDSEIIEAVEAYKPANNRSQIIRRENKEILLDAYNANPTSVELTVKTLEGYPADYKVAVLGDMFEVGKTTSTEHQHIVDLLEHSTIDEAYVCGENFGSTRTEKVQQFKDFDALKKEMAGKSFPSSTVILIKGSRAMAMERLLEVF